MVSIAKGHTPLMFGVLTSRREGPTLSTVNALLEGGGDPYRADAEGLTIYGPVPSKMFNMAPTIHQ